MVMGKGMYRHGHKHGYGVRACSGLGLGLGLGLCVTPREVEALLRLDLNHPFVITHTLFPPLLQYIWVCPPGMMQPQGMNSMSMPTNGNSRTTAPPGMGVSGATTSTAATSTAASSAASASSSSATAGAFYTFVRSSRLHLIL